MESENTFRELQQSYLEELNEQVAMLESHFLRWEKMKDEDALKKSMALIHTMKGASGSYMLNDLSSFCHRLEDLILDENAKAEAKFSEALFQVIDILRTYIDDFDHFDPKKLLVLFDQLLSDYSLSQLKNCLILEMSRSMSTAYTTVVKKFGFNVSYSRDAFSALKRLCLEDFDLIVWSTNMNGFDGGSLYNAFKEIAPNKVDTQQTVLITTEAGNVEKLNSFHGEVLIKDQELLQNLESWMDQNYGWGGEVELSSTAKPGKSTVHDLSEVESIFFVDDSKAIIDLAQHIFVKQNPDIKVEFFKSPVEALEKMKDNFPDLVICDYQMDEMDGIAFKQALNKDSNLGDIPFLFLTGERDQHIIKEIDRLGALGIIKKPFNHRTLLNDISDALSAA